MRCIGGCKAHRLLVVKRGAALTPRGKPTNHEQPPHAFPSPYMRDLFPFCLEDTILLAEGYAFLLCITLGWEDCTMIA